MNQARMQEWIDEFLETSRQQWLLRFIAVCAAVGAVLANCAANDRWWPIGLIIATLLGTASAIRPDTHTGLIVIMMVIWRWVATVDSLETPWLPVASICLLVFHTVIALLATLPTGGELPIAIIVQWFGRVGLGSGLTIAMWALVIGLGRGEAPGNAILTGLALAVAAGAAVAIRSRSIDQPQ